MKTETTERQTASWWWGNGYYKIFEAIVERFYIMYFDNDVRGTWQAVKAMISLIMPIRGVLTEVERQTLFMECNNIQSYIMASPAGYKLNSLYDAGEDAAENLKQMDRILQFYMELMGIMDRNNMLFPKNIEYDEEQSQNVLSNYRRNT